MTAAARKLEDRRDEIETLLALDTVMLLELRQNLRQLHQLN